MGRSLDYSTRFSGGRVDYSGADIAAFTRIRGAKSSPAQYAIRREWEQQSVGCFACARKALYRRIVPLSTRDRAVTNVGACSAHRDALMALKTHQPQDTGR